MIPCRLQINTNSQYWLRYTAHREARAFTSSATTFCPYNFGLFRTFRLFFKCIAILNTFKIQEYVKWLYTHKCVHTDAERVVCFL